MTTLIESFAFTLLLAMFLFLVGLLLYGIYLAIGIYFLLVVSSFALLWFAVHHYMKRNS